jgi:hypothetical protein
MLPTLSDVLQEAVVFCLGFDVDKVTVAYVTL